MEQRLAQIARCSILMVIWFAAGCGQDNERGVWSEELKVCPAGATVKGIDVSEYQGNIDWTKVAGGGYGFAIARINDGHHNDADFTANWAGMKTVGLVRGAYQFYEPTLDSSWQADVVINAVGKLGDGDLGVTLDVETPYLGGSPNATDVRTWVDRVAAGTGKTPMIYTALGYWDNYFSNQFTELPLWVANWGVTCPNLPNGWTNWFFWQSADTGTVPGISGAVDQDEFNGSLEELKAFANYDNANGCTPSQIIACEKTHQDCLDGKCVTPADGGPPDGTADAGGGDGGSGDAGGGDTAEKDGSINPDEAADSGADGLVQDGGTDVGISDREEPGDKISGGCSCGTATGGLQLIGMLLLPLWLLRRRTHPRDP